MAHYLVRILGDLFGGQSIKKYVNTMYARNNINKVDPDDGVKFCCFEKNTLIYLINWLNSLLKDDRPANLLVVDEDPLSILTLDDYEKIVAAANSSFSTHIAIYDELEKTRTRAAELEESAKAQASSSRQDSPVSIANNNNSFFSQHSSAITAATAAALATGLLLVGAFVSKPG